MGTQEKAVKALLIVVVVVELFFVSFFSFLEQEDRNPKTTKQGYEIVLHKQYYLLHNKMNNTKNYTCKS